MHVGVSARERAAAVARTHAHACTHVTSVSDFGGPKPRETRGRERTKKNFSDGMYRDVHRDARLAAKFIDPLIAVTPDRYSGSEKALDDLAIALYVVWKNR